MLICIFIPPRNPRFLRCWHSQPVAFEEDVVVVVVVAVVVVVVVVVVMETQIGKDR